MIRINSYALHLALGLLGEPKGFQIGEDIVVVSRLSRAEAVPGISTGWGGGISALAVVKVFGDIDPSRSTGAVGLRHS